jgi:hypothetical protein
MAKLYITEFELPPQYAGGALYVTQMPPLAEQTITITGTSQSSSSFGQYTRIIAVHTDSTCSISISLNPVATVNKKRLYANTTEYFGVLPGQKIAVISNT